MPNTKEQGAAAQVSARRERLRPEERRERLLDALLEQVTNEGFGAVSMESIARSGAIAKTVVYNAFGDVDGALNALFAREQERAFAAIAAAVPLPPYEVGPAALAVPALRALLDDVRSRPDSWRLLLMPGPGTPPAVRESIEAHRLRLVEQLQPAIRWALGLYDASQLDAELVAYTVIAAVEHAARLTLEAPDRYSTDRLVAFVEDLATLIAARTG
jgi:AcrR family transcriptional regulator